MTSDTELPRRGPDVEPPLRRRAHRFDSGDPGAGTADHDWRLAEVDGTIWWADGRTETLPTELIKACTNCGERRPRG